MSSNSKLQRNGVIMGYISTYCLVCERYLATTKETRDHILEDTHKDQILAHPYMEKYDGHHIRKVKKGYLCEFCNILLATASKMSLHVQEKSHYDKKGIFLLRCSNGTSDVITFGDVLISEKAWHSLSDGTCAICNEEFDDESTHKAQSEHLLKLVVNKVQFGAGNSLYRNTDDNSFQCITCNSVFTMDSLNGHFNDPEHKKLYAKCQEELKKYTEQNKITKPLSLNNSGDKKIGKDISVDNNDNIITVESKTDEKSAIQTNDCDKEIALKPECVETAVYAKENGLTYNAGNSNAFCRICELRLPANLRSMKEHVIGKVHKSKTASATRLSQTACKACNPSINKRSMNKFIDRLSTIKNPFFQDIVINDKYCMSLVSFIMFTKNEGKFRCQACEVNVEVYGVKDHIDTPLHEIAMDETPVITSLPASEFVREVRPGIFHCGYCNLVIPRWEEVNSHLQALEHKKNKDGSEWRLRRHMPAIQRHRREEMAVFRMLLRGNMFRF